MLQMHYNISVFKVFSNFGRIGRFGGLKQKNSREAHSAPHTPGHILTVTGTDVPVVLNIIPVVFLRFVSWNNYC